MIYITVFIQKLLETISKDQNDQGKASKAAFITKPRCAQHLPTRLISLNYYIAAPSAVTADSSAVTSVASEVATAVTPSAVPRATPGEEEAAGAASLAPSGT